MGVMKRSVAALLFAASCNWPTAPSEVPKWVLPYWVEAQDRLVEAGYPRARHIPPHYFEFVGHEPGHIDGDAYMMDGQWVYGHFDPNRAEIHFCVTIKRVVRHEAGHAILWAIHRSEWQCWEHPCWEE